MKKEAGLYLIKRVEKLPKRGNGNWLYMLKTDPVTKFYRWTSGGYEEINLPTVSEGGAEEITGVYKAMLSSSYAGGAGAVPNTVIREISNTTGLTFNWQYGGTGVMYTSGLFGDGQDHTEDIAINVGSTFDQLLATINDKNVGYITHGSETEAYIHIATGTFSGAIIEVVYIPVV